MDERLYDHTKDGPPRTRVQKVIALNYLISSALVLLVGLIGAMKMPRRIFNWRTFWLVFISSNAIALTWGAFLLNKDPSFPSWLLLPWGTVGNLWVWPIEDVIFYAGCTIAFYFVFRWFHFKFSWHDFRFSNFFKLGFLFVMVWSAVFMVFFGEAAGRSIALLYACPVVLLMFYVWPEINSKQLIVFVLVLTAFELIWDWFCASWIHGIPGMSWASGWVYLSFDAAGNPHQSNVFIDYARHPWGWIFQNPIELTPWYGFAGASYLYMVVKSLDKFTSGWARG